MKIIKNEMYCRECGHSDITEDTVYECPKCGCENVFNTRILSCDCGADVVLSSFTNECENCGRLYNKFGQSLRPYNEWDLDAAF